MEKKLVVKVVGMDSLFIARRAAEDGNRTAAAETLDRFAWKNSTLQSEAGDIWGLVKMAVLDIRAGRDTGKVFGMLWSRVLPHLSAI